MYTSPLGSVDLLYCEVKRQEHSKMPNCFCVNSKGRGNLLLSADNPREAEQWIGFIADASMPRLGSY
eukprot:1182887-Prorocentrum_minimum.AAC.2